MIVAVGSDHRGADVLPQLIAELEGRGCKVLQQNNCTGKICDYPDMAYPVSKAVASGEADRGILICGSGIGMSIAANKVKGARAALVHDEIGAEMSRRHNDANVLCLAADLLSVRVIQRVIDIWLETEFEAGRHARRVEKIAAIESDTYSATVTCS